MTFPSTPLNTKVELDLNGTWTDIVRLDNNQAGVYQANEIEITRGRTDELRDFDTSSCALTLNNRDGRFSPRKPDGPYYGQIGRNTPIRVSVDQTESSLRITENYGASAPDTTQLSVTGDIDLRCDLEADSWVNGEASYDLIRKYTTTGNQRSYNFQVLSTGFLRLQWSNDGTTVLSSTSTLVVPITTGRLSVRVTLDVNNGAGGNTVAFYYSTDTNLSTASWTALGSSVVTAGTTSIFDSTATCFIGFVSLNTHYIRIYSCEIRNGIASTVVGNPNFAIQSNGTSSFADTAGTPQTWTINTAQAEVSNRDYRFYGEVSSWPIEWDTSGNDVQVDIQCAGPMRRLGQGAQALGSALYRGSTRLTSLVAYWPCEEGTDATKIGSAIPDGTSMTYSGTPNFATYQGTFKSSDPIPELNGSSWHGSVKSYTPASPAEIQLQFLLHISSSSPPADGTVFMRLFCSGTASRWDMVYNTAGGFTVNAYTGDTSVLSDGPWAFDLLDRDLLFVLQLNQNGSDVNYGAGVYEVNDPTFGLLGTGTQTLAGKTISAATGVHVNPPGSAGLSDDAIGHVTIQSAINEWTNPYLQINAYSGETAAERITRICDEEGISVRVLGDPSTSAALGFQPNTTLLELLREAARTDLGFLFESRDSDGLIFRPLKTIYNQTATITLNYASNQMQTLTPVDDDAAVRNDVTAKRSGGGSYRATKDSGALSTLAPPSGVGRYDDTFEVSLETDNFIEDHANWRLHMGTVDEPRYRVSVNMNQSQFTSSASQTTAAKLADLGARVDVSNPPTWLPPDTIRMVAQGINEKLSNFSHQIEFIGQPYAPFAVGVYGTARYSATGTITAEALDTTETGVDITCPSATEYWSHADGDFDIIIGGERMTVTAISGTGVSQTLTVTRSVNGVVKSHATGADVALFTPAYYAL